MTSILVLGATGYIGSTFVTRMSQEIPQIQLTALVRNAAHVGVLRDLGVNVVLGNVDDLGKVIDLASNADIVVNAALSDNIPLVQAILAGQRSHPPNGRKRTLIHLSRSALSLHQEEPHALQLQTTFTNDLDTDLWLATESNDMSRLVDNEIIEAVDDPSLATYVVCPTTVFGDANTQFPRRSHQLRSLIQCAVERRRMILPTDGTNMRSGIHIEDLMDLLLRITRHAMARPIDCPAERTQFFFASGSEFYWGHVAAKAAQILYQRRLLSCAEVSIGRLKDHPELREYLTNIRVQSLRGKALGWSPNPERSILDVLDREIEAILRML